MKVVHVHQRVVRQPQFTARPLAVVGGRRVLGHVEGLVVVVPTRSETSTQSRPAASWLQKREHIDGRRGAKLLLGLPARSGRQAHGSAHALAANGTHD
eukprot:7381923-Prymnesium_polylepis.1